MAQSVNEALVLDVVRAERSWVDLEHVGLTISFMDDGCDCDGLGTVVVAPSVKDLSRGLIRRIAGRESDLRRWASVVLAASAVIDLEKVEAHPEGEVLISALWDASGGHEIGSEAQALARRLVE